MATSYIVGPLNPQNYSSPSGAFVLEVDPSDPKGRGEGTYRLTKNGEEVWAAKHPFTFFNAGVTDDGISAGYAYTYGVEGYRPENAPSKPAEEGHYGRFQVIIFDEAGNIRLNRSTIRKDTRKMNIMPQPTARGMFVDKTNDLLVVRVHGPDDNRDSTVWNTFRLSTGEDVPEIQPGNVRDAREIDAQPVPETSLILLQYRIWNEQQMRDAYVLVTVDGKVVWSLDVPGEQSGEIHKTSIGGTFQLQIGDPPMRVKYAVNEANAHPNGWVVQKIGSEKYVPDDKKPKEISFPSIQLKPLGKTILDSKDQFGQDNVAFDAEGRIYAESGNTGDIHVFENDGSLSHVCKLRSDDLEGGVKYIFVGSDGSIHVYGRRQYVRFSVTGKRLGVDSLPSDAPWYRGWQITPDGRHSWRFGHKWIGLYDSDGQAVRTTRRRPDRNWLDLVCSGGVAPDSSIAAVSISRPGNTTINIYDRTGGPQKTISMPTDEVRYEKVAFNGRYCVFGQKESVLILDTKTEAIRSFTPQHELSKKPSWKPFFSPDGKQLWLWDWTNRVVVRFEGPTADFQ
jgi:hypothetical protein